MRLAGFVAAACCCLAALPGAAASPAAEVREWDFRVLLDDAEIGYHRFRLTQRGDQRQVESAARFDVRILFLTAYRYRHSNVETWAGDCLEQIETDTDANGRETRISGARRDDRFVVEAGPARRELPECVMSFAYWDPAFLDQPSLLNPQTGEYVAVEIEEVGSDRLTVRGREVAATRYRISAAGTRIDVWYTDNREWVALESETRGGRLLRYELRS